ncbi:MAG TPA: hypothetical protein VLJ57_24895 [Burkholderiaceae bacterium]|nr:hypothetical protein [Burkholderiaceae bacterium]
MRALLVGAVVLALYGIVTAKSDYILAAYLVLVFACLLPTFLWLRSGAEGIPILPAFALAHLPYFALSVIRPEGLLHLYEPEEILVASSTVSAFLISAAATAHLGRSAQRLRPPAPDPEQSARQLSLLILTGLSCGLVFQVGAASGVLQLLDTLYGTARSLASTFALVACYCFGVGAGQRLLTKRDLLMGGLLVGANVLVSWSSLFLVGGMMYLMAGTVGFVVATGRVPWKSFLLVFAVVSVLQAGKRDMRDVYWYAGANYGNTTSVADLPDRLMEWTARGIEVLTSSDAEFVEVDPNRPTVLDRTSLIRMMLWAQRMAPDMVEHLDGATYALLPQVLMPRFIFPDKPASQAGMDMLNVHFAVLLEHETEKTAVGWGLAAEAYANFGYAGVLAMGALVGILARVLTQRSAGHSGVSLPSLVAIAALINMINMEADFIGLFMSLLQSAVAVFVFYYALSMLTRREFRKHPGHAPGVGLVTRK